MPTFAANFGENKHKTHCLKVHYVISGNQKWKIFTDRFVCFFTESLFI